MKALSISYILLSLAPEILTAAPCGNTPPLPAEQAKPLDSNFNTTLSFISKFNLAKIQPTDSEKKESSIRQINECLEANYQDATAICIQNLKAMQVKLAKKQNIRDGYIMAGTGFAGIAPVATFHPVSAALAAIGAWFAGNSERAATRESVDNSIMQDYQKSLNNAYDEYYKEISEALKETNPDQLFMKKEYAIDRLRVACNQIGLHTNYLPANTDNKSTQAASEAQ